jgi:hypothetical protein
LKDKETIILRRGSKNVSNLLSSFSNSLRETRITSLLGYIISLEPDLFTDFFDIKGILTSISIESKETGDNHRLRTDIKIETTLGIAIIEAKVGATDPTEQSLLYTGNWRILITEYLPNSSQLRLRNVQYYRWRDLVPLLQKVSTTSKSAAGILSHELIIHLEEHMMIKSKEAVEIYSRDINDEVTTRLFLKGHMYGCDVKKESQMSQAIYFAPYFGRQVAETFPGLQEGISYLGRVVSVDVVDSINAWKKLARKHYRDSGNINSRLELIDELSEAWNWDDNNQRFIFFLKPPRLVFNPSIKKHLLQGGSGWLSKHFYSFENFFDAWGGEKIY